MATISEAAEGVTVSVKDGAASRGAASVGADASGTKLRAARFEPQERVNRAPETVKARATRSIVEGYHLETVTAPRVDAPTLTPPRPWH
jgi:hypothetical protein